MSLKAACGVCSLGSQPMCTGCLLFPSCEEQGSDTACPFSSLWTFDTPSAEVSLTYFPLAALLQSCCASQHDGGAARVELLTPPLLSWCVKSPPFVRSHVQVHAYTFFLFFRCVGGITSHIHRHTLTGLFWSRTWSALWALQVDAWCSWCSWAGLLQWALSKSLCVQVLTPSDFFHLLHFPFFCILSQCKGLIQTCMATCRA